MLQVEDLPGRQGDSQRMGRIVVVAQGDRVPPFGQCQPCQGRRRAHVVTVDVDLRPGADRDGNGGRRRSCRTQGTVAHRFRDQNE